MNQFIGCALYRPSWDFHGAKLDDIKRTLARRLCGGLLSLSETVVLIKSRMEETTHFDRRGARYDQDETHQHIVTLLLDPFTIAPGVRILDLATGTGLVAVRVAKLVGSCGEVVGLDTSAGMLATARRSAAEAQLSNVRFEQGDAELANYESASFDRIFCASALVFMPDVKAALLRWRHFLKPGGTIAFDTPAKPFGFSQLASDAALRNGMKLSYGDLADTSEKCRALLTQADLEVVSVRKAFINTTPIKLDIVIAMYDERIDHPAWRGIKEANPEVRKAIRDDFIKSATADAVDGYVPNDVALFFLDWDEEPYPTVISATAG